MRAKGTAGLGVFSALPSRCRALPRLGNAASGREEVNEVRAKYGWEASRLESSENTQMVSKMLMIQISSKEFQML